jgi:predicted phage baseplate assembly protein
MSRLAPDLFQRRYGDLVEIGRSRLPSLAPAWTDHNAHDPGITLIELLAWIAEAQLYSLSRTRRDERGAYAALMGVEPHGSRPSRGLIWPDHDDPDAPAATVFRGSIIEPDSPIRFVRAEKPSFRPVHRQLWIPARTEALTSRLADGTVVNHLAANRRGGPAFQPFGEEDGRGAVLRMELAPTGYSPLFESARPDDARLIIGVRADAPRGGPVAVEPGSGRASPLVVTLVADGERIPLPIVEDSTEGLLRTGALVLGLAGVETMPLSAVFEFEAPEGFERAPRILRIEPNVVPIVQRLEASERHQSDGSPDQGFDLETPGIEFEPGSDPVRVEVVRQDGAEEWTKCDRLADCGPGDRRFALDPMAARISFGNGVNGAVPPADAAIVVRYRVSEGKAGNVAANRKWMVRGFTGVFGVNPDPTFGGEDPSGWLEQRRRARIAVREGHALVSASDFEEAARRLSGLEVGRAWMMPLSPGDAATGTMRMVVMRARPGCGEPPAIQETARWLDAVRRRLAPRTPLGSRLRLLAPAYAGFLIRARVEAEAKKNPTEVRQAIVEELARRLTLISATPGVPQRPFGLPVTRRDLTAWIQALSDVRRVSALSIVLANGRAADEVTLARNGLPRIDLARSEIIVERAGSGGAL